MFEKGKQHAAMQARWFAQFRRNGIRRYESDSTRTPQRKPPGLPGFGGMESAATRVTDLFNQPSRNVSIRFQVNGTK